MNSLTARLLAVTGVVLVAFVAFTGFAMVLDGDGEVAWRSPSLVDRIPLPEVPAVGEWRFDTEVRGRGADDRWLTLAFGIRWVVDGGES